MILSDKCHGNSELIAMVIALLTKFSLIVPYEEQRQSTPSLSAPTGAAASPATSQVVSYIVPSHLCDCDDEALTSELLIDWLSVIECL
jgi:hypothetical protein